MTKQSEIERNKAIEDLRKMLSVGTTVYTILRHVSRSGMQRAISVMIVKDNKPHDISYLVSKALGWKLHRKQYGVKVDGCGMDMGFHLVYSLSSVIFRNGFECIGEKCPSNDHVNRHETTQHKDGGYALIHRWL